MGLAIEWTIQLNETNNTSFNHLQLLHKTSQRLNYRLNKQVGICPRISKKVFLSCSVDQERKYSKPRQTCIVRFSDF